MSIIFPTAKQSVLRYIVDPGVCTRSVIRPMFVLLVVSLQRADICIVEEELQHTET